MSKVVGLEGEVVMAIQTGITRGVTSGQIGSNGKVKRGSGPNVQLITWGPRQTGREVASTAANTTITNRIAGMIIEFDVISVMVMVTRVRYVVQIGNIRKMAMREVPLL